MSGKSRSQRGTAQASSGKAEVFPDTAVVSGKASNAAWRRLSGAAAEHGLAGRGLGVGRVVDLAYELLEHVLQGHQRDPVLQLHLREVRAAVA
ncbi:hypothetical protein GCM10009539_08070 [Cryptosporangium japonicum]|uniref:Uncharacterized protein n=1 Tax=Cryptosporangium japonicum TaxID=80872 RepID=A0ABN0TMB7_9ACTN